MMFMNYIINIGYILHVYNILSHSVYIILPSMYVNLFILLPYLMLIVRLWII